MLHPAYWLRRRSDRHNSPKAAGDCERRRRSLVATSQVMRFRSVLLQTADAAEPFDSGSCCHRAIAVCTLPENPANNSATVER